jgi:transposase
VSIIPGFCRQKSLLADKAYDADRRVIAPLAVAGQTAVIPSKRNRLGHCHRLRQDRQKLPVGFPHDRRYRTGIPWRDPPEALGDWNNTHQRFSRWAARGVWERLLTV